MSPSAFRSELKLLLDENVRSELEPFLKSKELSVISPKGVANGNLAALSKAEKRILVTNDADFTDPVLFPKEKIFALIWLRIPQNDPEALLRSFSALLKEKTKQKDFEGQLITLKKDGFESSPILGVKHIK